MARQDKWDLLLKKYKEKLFMPGQTCKREVIQAVSCLHEKLFTEQLTVSYIKEECNINGKSFPARFKQCMGKKPKEYIVYHRVEAGKLLLKETTATVTDIALHLGFSSLSSFDKTFYNRVGMTPSEWRKAAKDGNPEEE